MDWSHVNVKSKHEKKRKRVNSDDESEDDYPILNRIRLRTEGEQAVEILNEKHGSNYTPMQYRIWSELHANGMHADLDKALNNSMFKRAGANTLN